MPEAPQPQVVSTRKCQPRCVWLLLVLGSPTPISEHALAGEADPLAARSAVIVEIQHRMSAENFDAAPDEQRQEDDIEGMRETNAERETEFH